MSEQAAKELFMIIGGLAFVGIAVLYGIYLGVNWIIKKFKD
jgi:hypothetical protein